MKNSNRLSSDIAIKIKICRYKFIKITEEEFLNILKTVGI
jgi:hypothetical protein